MQDDGIRDDSRPAFARPQCSLGIYLDAIDARPDHCVTVGLTHAFMMRVMEKMLDHLRSLDLAKIKGVMDRKQIFDGVILDSFNAGCLLAVSFDTLDAAEQLWLLHRENNLSSVCQDMFVDKALLKATNTVKVTLRAKIWEDEYMAVRHEIAARSPARLRLSDFACDLHMVQRVKEFQKTMSGPIMQARDAESQFEQNLGEFMLMVKQALPATVSTLRNVKELSTNMNMTRDVKKPDFDTIGHYFDTLELFKTIFTDVEENIVYPLRQVRAICENEKQRDLKIQIKTTCAEVITLLKPETDLQQVRFKEWELKVLPREQDLFYGLVSLIPLCLDNLTSLDLNVDEYVMDFAEMSG